MTAVPPFVPALQTSAQPTMLPQTLTIGPTVTFAQLVRAAEQVVNAEVAASLQVRQSGAALPAHSFRFAELGMFGRHGSQEVARSAVAMAQTQETSFAADTLAVPDPAVPTMPARQARSRVERSDPPTAMPAERSSLTADKAPEVAARHAVDTHGDASRAQKSAPTVTEQHTRATVPVVQKPHAGVSPAAEPARDVPARVLVTATEMAVPARPSPRTPVGPQPAEAEVVAAPVSAAVTSPRTVAKAEPGPILQAGKAARPAPLPRTSNPTNLVVAQKGDGLVIAARGQIASAEDFFRLRRAIEAAAAEFGMDVAEFRLNGGHDPFATTPGGKFGNRSR